MSAKAYYFLSSAFRRSAIANAANFKWNKHSTMQKLQRNSLIHRTKILCWILKFISTKSWSRLYYRKWRLLKFFVFIKRSWKQLLSSIDHTWKSSLILKKYLRSLCNKFNYIVFFVRLILFTLVVGVFENLFTESFYNSLVSIHIFFYRQPGC